MYIPLPTAVCPYSTLLVLENWYVSRPPPALSIVSRGSGIGTYTSEIRVDVISPDSNISSLMLSGHWTILRVNVSLISHVKSELRLLVWRVWAYGVQIYIF